MKWLGAALLGGSLLLPPLLAGDFYINLASQILIAAIFALSLNLLVGFGGMTSLGHASYLGVAAYLSALLTSRYGFGHGSAALISMSGTIAMAAFFGVIALRASGLGKRFGWGIHADAEGRVAIYAVDSERYQALARDPKIAQTRAMRSKRA